MGRAREGKIIITCCCWPRLISISNRFQTRLHRSPTTGTFHLKSLTLPRRSPKTGWTTKKTWFQVRSNCITRWTIILLEFRFQTQPRKSRTTGTRKLTARGKLHSSRIRFARTTDAASGSHRWLLTPSIKESGVHRCWTTPTTKANGLRVA